MAIVGLTYSGLILFLWSLLLAIGAARLLRQARIQREEMLYASGTSNPAAMRRVLAYIHSPLDDMRAWNSSRDYPKVGDNAPPVPNSEVMPGPLVLPMRYRQTLLYGDEISDPPRA